MSIQLQLLSDVNYYYEITSLKESLLLWNYIIIPNSITIILKSIIIMSIIYYHVNYSKKFMITITIITIMTIIIIPWKKLREVYYYFITESLLLL